MITVCLYGGLREYGRRFRLHAETPAEALRALFVQIKGLREAVRAGYFQVRFGGKDVTETTIEADFRQVSAGVLHIVPRVAGSGKAGQVIAGIVLVVVGVVVTGLSYGWAAPVGGALISAGVGLIVGGVAAMLTKQPDFSKEEHGMKQSRNTAFSNLDNTAAQGQPVPIAYGNCYCGSRVVSLGIESRRLNADGDVVLENPEAVDVSLAVEKTFISGVAAIAPNGEKYNTDFADDSVKARNYTAVLKKG